MKRVKVMLSGILVMAIVAGALAFKVKTEEVCLYTKVISQNPPTTTICNRVSTLPDFLKTKATLISTVYATTTVPVAGTCPTTTKVCSQSITLTDEAAN